MQLDALTDSAMQLDALTESAMQLDALTESAMQLDALTESASSSSSSSSSIEEEEDVLPPPPGHADASNVATDASTVDPGVDLIRILRREIAVFSGNCNIHAIIGDIHASRIIAAATANNTITDTLRNFIAEGLEDAIAKNTAHEIVCEMLGRAHPL